MKKIIISIVIILLLGTFTAVLGDSVGLTNFELRRFAIVGNGEISTEGEYRISRSISPFIAQTSTDGEYTLRDGIWSADAPTQKIFLPFTTQ